MKELVRLKTPQRTKILATRALRAMNAQNAETVICRIRRTPGPNQFRKFWTNSRMTPHTSKQHSIRRDYATGRAEIQFFLQTLVRKMDALGVVSGATP